MTDDLIDLLLADLAAAEFKTTNIEALLGESPYRALKSGVTPAARRVLARRPASALAILIRLFLMGETIPEREIRIALPALGAEGLLELGFAEHSEVGLRAKLSLNSELVIDDANASNESRHEWLIISDLDDHLRHGPARKDHVMGVGGATRSLIAQLPPTGFVTGGAARTLDLGTGCGIVALHLALRSPHVIATDISSRALKFARANARLNGLAERIEFREGNLFEPVQGEEFGLIASNPPFVITPRLADVPVYEYRDGGRAGDDLAADVVRTGSQHLAQGGTLVCLANWESPWGGNGLERVRGWITDAKMPELAAWVVERDRLDPLAYAQMWARDGGERPGSASYDRRIEDWINDFEARRVVSIGLGSIRITRGEGSQPEPVIHLEQAAGAYADGHTGGALAAAFAAGVAAAHMGDDEMLATHWVRDTAVVEHREHEPGVEAPRAISLSTDRPIARRVAADPLLAAAVGACDGDLTLGQIADALATLLEVDVEASREALIASVRELTWLGMLAPAASRGTNAPVDWRGDAND